MLIGLKDAAKLVGIIIVSACAVVVCVMFANFYIDLLAIEDLITAPQMKMMYNAQCMTAKVVCGVSGGCLLATAIVMLIFYIKNYIDTHKKDLGILKALGYSNFSIAKNFWVFGFSILVGTLLGFIGAVSLLPMLYEYMNKDNLLPVIEVKIHYELIIYFVIIPTVLFVILSVGYALFRMKTHVNMLLKDIPQEKKIKKHKTDKETNRSFIQDLKSSTLKSKKSLIFFIIFAAFCYGAMTQMSFYMNDIASEMMGVMMMVIGLVLAFTTLFMAITTVINGNKKTIAIMRTFGYSQKQCTDSILGCYRPMSYIGFAIGTLYQYVLLKVMVNIVFKGVEDVEGVVPVYEFDLKIFFMSLVSFLFVYEVVMYIYSEKVKKISVKEIMLEE